MSLRSFAWRRLGWGGRRSQGGRKEGREVGKWEGRSVLKGSWDLVTRVITKVTILIITYNPT